MSDNLEHLLMRLKQLSPMPSHLEEDYDKLKDYVKIVDELATIKDPKCIRLKRNMFEQKLLQR